MKKKTLLFTTLAGTMLATGLTLSGVKAATESKVVINEEDAKVVVEVPSATYQLTKTDLEDMIEAEYESKDLAEVTAEVQGETAGTGAKVKLANTYSGIEELTVIVYGDVTGDGVANVLDLNEMRKVVLGQKTFEDNVKVAANVVYDEGGAVNVLDANRIAQFILHPADYAEKEYIDEGILPEENIGVCEHTKTYTHVEETNQHKWTCSKCEKTGVEDCTFGEWKSTDGKVATRTCTAAGCGNKEEKNIVEMLNDASVTELTVDKVNTNDAALTVPAGKTLTVDTITGRNKVTVNGNLVLTKKPSNKLNLDGTGTVVYAPEVEAEGQLNTIFGSMKTVLENIGAATDNTVKSLTYEVKVPELSEPQIITETDVVTVGKGVDLTVDLGNNTLETTKSDTSFITNNGDLTLTNGTVKIPNNSTKFAINSGANMNANLTLDNVDIVGSSGISTNGNLVMNGGKIESTGTDGNARALQILGADAIKPIVTKLDDVEITTKNLGIYIHTDPFHDLEMTGGSITVTSGAAKDGAIVSSSEYSLITLDGTTITSDQLGIYLDNGGPVGENPSGGNVARLTNVTINSKGACLTTVGKGDKVEVTGGSYTSTGATAVYISSGELNTFKDCRLQGIEAAIKIRGALLLDHNFSDYVQKTGDVTVVDL